jgi:hypothetical protein
MKIAVVATTHKLWITMNAAVVHDGSHNIYVEAEVRGSNQGSATPLAISPKHHGYGYSVWKPSPEGEYMGKDSIAAYKHWGDPIAVRSHFLLLLLFLLCICFLRLRLASKASHKHSRHGSICPGRPPTHTFGARLHVCLRAFFLLAPVAENHSVRLTTPF